MRRDLLFDKYKNILINIITNYNNTNGLIKNKF